MVSFKHRLSDFPRNIKPESIMIPVPPNCQEIPGVILTLPNGHWLTKDGQETAHWPERGVWEDESAAKEFLQLLFPEKP